jgi:hypothetical protein
MYIPYRYANIGHTSIADRKASYGSPKFDDRANGFMPRYKLLTRVGVRVSEQSRAVVKRRQNAHVQEMMR